MYEQKIAEIESKIINGEILTEKELGYCAQGDVGNFIDEVEGDSGRWTKYVYTIFEVGNQLYRIDWREGLTEYQENEYFFQPYKVRREERVITTTVVNYAKVED